MLFDLDGLLINSEQIYTNQLSKFLSRHGREYNYRVKRLMMGRKPLEAAGIMCQEYNLPMTPNEVLEDYGKELPLEIWHSATLMPGAQKLIEHLKQNSIPMAVASGSSSQQVPHKMWNHRDLWQHIHHVVAAGDDPEVSFTLIAFYKLCSYWHCSLQCESLLLSADTLIFCVNIVLHSNLIPSLLLLGVLSRDLPI